MANRKAVPPLPPDMRGVTLRALSYGLIHAAGPNGMTALEVVAASGRDRWGIQPRISELVSAKAVVNTGRTRTNPSGRKAIVWAVPDCSGDYDAPPFGDIAARVVADLGRRSGCTIEGEVGHD